MIAATGGGAGFGGAIDYTTREDEEKGAIEWMQEQLGIKEREVRVSEVQTRNLVMDDLDHIKDEMRITANQNSRVEKPRYSLSISYHPSDDPSDEEMIEDMDTFLQRRGLGEHQAVYAVHRDRDHAHIHATINRVQPETGDLWRDSYDYYKNMSVLREIEQERGWTRPKRDDSRGRIADWKIQKSKRTGEKPFGKEVAEVAGDVFERAETWLELQKGLAEKGLQVQRKGSGGIVTDGEEEAPLSEVARKWSFNKLDAQFPDEFEALEPREPHGQDVRKQTPNKEIQQLQSEIKGHLEAGRDRLAAETFELRTEEKKEVLRENLSNEVRSKLRQARKRKEEMINRTRPVKERLSDKGREAWREAKIHARAAAVARFGSAQESRELEEAGKAWKRVSQELSEEDRNTLMQNGLPDDISKRIAREASGQGERDAGQFQSKKPDIDRGRSL